MIQDQPEVRTFERSNNATRRTSIALPSAGPPRRSSISASAGGGRRGSKAFGHSAERSNSVWSEEESSGKRRKSLMMDSSLKGFKRMIDNTEQFMEEEIEQLPIRIQDRWFSLKKTEKKKTTKAIEVRNSNSRINHVFLLFKSMDWYKEYIQEHDPLFK